MQTSSISIGPGVEIACDESGFSGRNLVRSDTPVFAHASVRLSAGSATRLIRELRDRSRAPGSEYKSSRLLREQDRSRFEWFLGPPGPLYGNAHVHLTDKAFFVVCRAVQLLVGELPTDDVEASLGLGLSPDPYARGLAVTLHHGGPTAFGYRRWQAFLDAANDLVTGGRVLDRPALVDAFFDLLDELGTSSLDGRAGQVGQVLRLLRRSGAREQPRRARLLGDPRLVPALDPFVPAIVAAVRHWSQQVGPVVIVHDEQSVLNRRRIGQLYQILRRPGPDHPVRTTTPMSGLRGADSRRDPRVQVADLLAGLARRIASDSLVGTVDPGLATLLRPYLDEHSLWPDDPGCRRVRAGRPRPIRNQEAQATEPRLAWPAYTTTTVGVNMTGSTTQGIKTVLHPVSDLEKAKAVYAALLGVPPQTDGSYYVGFDAEGQHVGLVPGGGPQGMTSPVAYWHVPDIEAKLAEVTAAGATVKEPARDVGGGRLVATVTDPDGNLLGLLQDR